MTIDFGTDLYCDPVTEDADALFSTITGVPLVAQDLRHRLQVDSVLGPDGEFDFIDIRRLAGSTAGTASAYKARIKRCALKDQRIATADVIVTESASSHGLVTLTITVACTTALGPFRLVFTLDPTIPTATLVDTLVGQ